jgi:hydrogenase expression/formation protein HypD
VTAQGEIDAFIELSRLKDVIVTTFGDLMRVPGSDSSLQKEKAAGRDVRMVYSTMDALDIAQKHPDKKVVFLGVGFETTAPTIAAAILSAAQMGLANFFVVSAHKRVPPALDALAASESVNLDGLILPGHVSVIIGVEGYRPFFDRYRIPCAVAGFEPADILQALWMLVDQVVQDAPKLENAYPRAVSEQGNPRAREMMDRVFEPADAVWRGIGAIPQSGLKIREEFAAFDAQHVFSIDIQAVPEPRGCACGSILTGAMTPPQCPLFRTVCKPTDPVGPCMVSTEGTCAAWYRYHGGDRLKA